MKNFKFALLLVVFCFLGAALPVWAEPLDAATFIKREVAHAMVESRGVDFSSITDNELKKVFAEIFLEEKSKVNWVQSVVRLAGRYKNLNANVNISNPGATLAPEDFIEINLGATWYVFYKSGRTAFGHIGEMQSENFSIKKFHQNPLGGK